MASSTAVAATALILAGLGGASAQTFVVQDDYGPPPYAVAPAPVYPAYPAYPGYSAPVIVVPVPHVYVSPAPMYAAPIVAPSPYWGGPVAPVPRPGWTTDVGYPDGW